tara:strand:- start:2586 stop:3542 length:957 start_codon:yes stop_codon:yes gene_type:complete
VWLKDHCGAVLSTAIDKYAYITCRVLPPFFEHKYRIVWSRTELTQTPEEIAHPTVRETIKYIGTNAGLEIHYDGDLPARTGLGTSSAFTVGLLHALYALKGMMPSKLGLAKEAIHIEQGILKRNVGCQDQLACAFGGFNRMEFSRDEVTVSPLTLTSDRLRELERHLMLVFTGFSRDASEITAKQIKATPNHKNELSEMCDMVHQSAYILQSSTDIREFGKLMHCSWQLKKSLADSITSPYIDEIYGKALEHGAEGGKLLGAGGGGFMLFFADPEIQPKIREELKDINVAGYSPSQVPFRFERTGSQVIFYEPDGYVG